MSNKDVETPNNHPPHVSTTQQQSWGAFMAIVLILAMIIVGAYYAFNKRAGNQPATRTGIATSSAS